jgi:hypothetical protein
MNAVTPYGYVSPADPAELGWPPIFPIEIALRVAPIKEICDAHNITKGEWDHLRLDPGFQNVLAGYLKMLREEGGAGFKLKARIQAEELLKTSWEIIHGPDTPPAVKADLIKHTVRFAGLDASIDQKNNAGLSSNNFQININLGGD